MVQIIRRDRALATAAGFAVLAGALIILVVLVAVPGPWFAGYVSEAGTGGRPAAVAYRCGLILLAVGVGLLAVAIRRVSVVAALLGLVAVLAATSGAVRCSSGCPLPPFEPTTAADVVHAAASIAGMLALAAAMVAVAGAKALGPATRRLARFAAAVTFALGGFLGLTMLFVGRGNGGAVLERLLLAVAVSWLIGTAFLTSRSSATRSSAPVSQSSGGKSPG